MLIKAIYNKSFTVEKLIFDQNSIFWNNVVDSVFIIRVWYNKLIYTNDPYLIQIIFWLNFYFI